MKMRMTWFQLFDRLAIVAIFIASGVVAWWVV